MNQTPTVAIEIPVLDKEERKKEEERKKKGAFGAPWFGARTAGQLGGMAGADGGAGFFGIKALGSLEAFLASLGAAGSLPALLAVGSLLLVAGFLSMWSGGDSANSGGMRGWRGGSDMSAPASGRSGKGGDNSLGYLRMANSGLSDAVGGTAGSGASGSSAGEGKSTEGGQAPAGGAPAIAIPPLPTDSAMKDAAAAAAAMKEKQAMAEALGKLSQNVGGGGISGATIGSFAGGLGRGPSVGANGIADGGFRDLSKDKQGKLDSMLKKAPAQALLRAVGRRAGGNRPFVDLKGISRMAPQFAPTQSASANLASQPFDGGLGNGGKAFGLGPGSVGIVGSPSLDNGDNSDYTPPAALTNPSWANDQQDAQKDAKDGKSMLGLAAMLFLIGLALMMSGNPIMMIIGAMLMMAALAVAAMGGSKGQQANDKGNKLQNQGQNAAANTANGMGDAVTSNANSLSGSSGDNASAGINSALSNMNNEMTTRQQTGVNLTTTPGK